jgi:deoxyadenosine/deoxycytidine kinase
MVKVIVFEGIDKTGKTSLIEALHKATNYKHIIVDRFAATAYAYGTLKNRKNFDMTELLQLFYDFAIFSDLIVIYVTCDKKVWFDRMKRANETSVSIDEFDLLDKYYREFFTHVKLNSDIVAYTIDTTTKNIEQCVSEIKEIIDKE